MTVVYNTLQFWQEIFLQTILHTAVNRSTHATGIHNSEGELQPLMQTNDVKSKIMLTNEHTNRKCNVIGFDSAVFSSEIFQFQLAVDG